MTFVSKSVDIWDGIVNPIYEYGVEITPDVNPIYRVFGNEGYTESGLKLINFWPNLVSKGFLAFTTNIRFDLYPLKEFISIILTSSLPFYLRPKN